VYRAFGSYYEYLWRHAEAFRRGFAEIGPETVDLVLLPTLETIGLLHLALHRNMFRGKSWAAIAHNIRFHHRSRGIGGPWEYVDVLQRALFSWVRRDRRLICLGTNDPYLPEAINDPKVVYCPHPAIGPVLCDTTEARAAYGIRPETCVILSFGVINRVKCIDLLLESVARLVPELDVTVLLAGAQTANDVTLALASPAAEKLRRQGRLIEVNRFIVEGVDIDPMNAADIVWVFYRKEFHGNSDVACRAGLARRPVIARRQGLAGNFIESGNMGLTLSSDDPDDLAAAIKRLATDPILRQRMGENGFRTFSGYTPDRLARPIVDAINREFERSGVNAH
jgi:glycosyltransferase involved in cell wall biosynthesis